MTPLHIACLKGHFEIVEYFMKDQEDINEKDAFFNN